MAMGVGAGSGHGVGASGSTNPPGLHSKVQAWRFLARIQPSPGMILDAGKRQFTSRSKLATLTLRDQPVDFGHIGITVPGDLPGHRCAS